MILWVRRSTVSGQHNTVVITVLSARNVFFIPCKLSFIRSKSEKNIVAFLRIFIILSEINEMNEMKISRIMW